MTETTTPKEMTAKEWLNYLPEPMRTEALEACERWPLNPDRVCQFNKCITYAIKWSLAGGKWHEVHTQVQSGQILPVEPEQSKQPEPKEKNVYEVWKSLSEKVGDMENDVNGLRKDVKQYSEILEKLNSSLVPYFEKLEKMEKHYDKLFPPTEDKQPEPAPVKLPVTVEEVWELEKGIIGRQSWLIGKYEISKSKFDASQLFTEYRHESTAKLVYAVRKLTKIAEAQNEMCERGEFVCVAAKNENEIEIDEIVQPRYGQIYFHSEQGLKDCIRANEQLWKDYLRIS